MTYIRRKEVTFKNCESPLTELFSLLTRYENSSSGSSTLAYNSDELIVMHLHIDNAIDVLLLGLQDLGHLIGVAAQSSKIKNIEDLNNIGFFISGISNLTEALNTLRLDADYVLKQREIINY